MTTTATDLVRRRCRSCEGGVPPLKSDELVPYLAAVPEWMLTPDGRRVVSGSHDQTMKVWDAATGQEVLTLRGHNHLVTSEAVSADGKRLVSGSADETVRVWDANMSQQKP